MTETVAENMDVAPEITDVDNAVMDNANVADKANTEKDDEYYQTPVFNRIQVRQVVKRERDKAFEKGKQMAMQELQQQAQPNQGGAEVAPQDQQQAPAASIGGMPQLTPDQIRQMIMEHAPKAFQGHIEALQNQHVTDSFVSKMKAAEAKYPGLEAQLNELDFAPIAPLIKMVNDMENTGDIMKELLDNPAKLGELTTLVHTQKPLAQKAIQSLSASIKRNVEAQAKEKSVQEPYSQYSPSLNSGKDDGDMTVSDFQKMFGRRR
jgi:hypothetical protein